MMRAFVIALVLVAACAEAPQSYRDLDRLGRDSYDPNPPAAADTCHMAQHADLVGKAPTEIDMTALPAGTRTICFGCMMTADHVSHRLNLQLGRDGKVASLRCG